MDLGSSPQWIGIANSIAGSVWLSSWIRVRQVPVGQVLGASGLVRRQITIEAWSLATAPPRPATRVNSFAVDKGFRSRKMSLPTWRSPITRPRGASFAREQGERLGIYVGRSFTRTSQFCPKPLHNTPQRVCSHWKRNPLERRRGALTTQVPVRTGSVPLPLSCRELLLKLKCHHGLCKHRIHHNVLHHNNTADCSSGHIECRASWLSVRLSNRALYEPLVPQHSIRGSGVELEPILP